MGIGKIYDTCKCGGYVSFKWNNVLKKTEYKCAKCNDAKPINYLPNIYIVGNAGSGKSTVVEIIKDNCPAYKVISISTPLYQLVEYVKHSERDNFIKLLRDMGLSLDESENIYENTPSDIIDYILDKSIEKKRLALLYFGDFLVEKSPNILIDYAISQIDEENSIYIVDDVRLVNEGDKLSKLEFLGVRIETDKEVREKRVLNRDRVKEDIENHRTEKDIFTIAYDYIINNNSENKEDLIPEIDFLLDYYGGERLPF